MIEFKEFPKIARLNRDVVITEKIDGTNAAIGIEEFPFGWHVGGTDPEGVSHDLPVNAQIVMGPDNMDFDNGGDGLPDKEYLVYAQSRKRIITPEQDNYGFAKWVWANAEALVNEIGPGLHYGEWWGNGIQRGYGLGKGDKRFSLFNVKRWGNVELTVPGLGVVPLLAVGPFGLVNWVMGNLRKYGSRTAPGYMNPEGIVVYHTAANMMFKATLLNDEKPKSETG